MTTGGIQITVCPTMTETDCLTGILLVSKICLQTFSLKKWIVLFIYVRHFIN